MHFHILKMLYDCALSLFKGIISNTKRCILKLKVTTASIDHSDLIELLKRVVKKKRKEKSLVSHISLVYITV